MESNGASSVTVAIVDDDAGLRDATRSLLASVGYRVVTYESAEEFLESPGSRGTGCLVLDIGLPGMTGLELQQFLIDSRLRIPIVFMTANYHYAGNIRELAMRAGAQAFLGKPFDDRELLAAVEVALQGRQ